MPDKECDKCGSTRNTTVYNPPDTKTDKCNTCGKESK